MQQYLAVLEKSWFELHQHYHFSEPQKIFNKLIATYSEKQRAYHTVQHLYECLVLLESIRADLNDANAIALALWFHDAAQDLSIEIIQNIKRWIVATQKHESTNELDLQFLLDIDLAILAASPARFEEYEQQIQKEYAWVNPEIYSLKRKEVLAHFYQTEPLYQTEYFQQNFEQRAKSNLKNIVDY
jgi:predicted metal-dependent HD superfamily phosphohydrolase